MFSFVVGKFRVQHSNNSQVKGKTFLKIFVCKNPNNQKLLNSVNCTRFYAKFDVGKTFKEKNKSFFETS